MCGHLHLDYFAGDFSVTNLARVEVGAHTYVERIKNMDERNDNNSKAQSILLFAMSFETNEYCHFGNVAFLFSKTCLTDNQTNQKFSLSRFGFLSFSIYTC